jgi:hypothetical protein
MANRKIKKQPMNEGVGTVLLVGVVLAFIGKLALQFFQKQIRYSKSREFKLDTPKKREDAKREFGIAIEKAYRHIADGKPGGATRVAMESVKSDVFMNIDNGTLKTSGEVVDYILELLKRAES